jgi:hypothetical protein
MLFDLSVLHPLQVPVNATPVFSPFNQWMIGVVLYKGWSKLVKLGLVGDEEQKRVIESLRVQRALELDIMHICKTFYFKINMKLGELIGTPYTIFRIAVLVFDLSRSQQAYCFRYLFFSYSLACFVVYIPYIFDFLIKQLQKKIFEEKYVIGKSLKNVQHEVLEAKQE